MAKHIKKNIDENTVDPYAPEAYGASHNSISRQYSRGAGQYKAKKDHKKIWIGLLSALGVAFLGCGMALAIYMGEINAKMHGNLSDEEKLAISEQLATATFDEPFYIMLIGSDRRDNSDKVTGQRSDVNMLVRVDANKGLATILSIPRDTRVDMGENGIQKFNAAYNFGGIAAVLEEASELTGAKIAHYADVNFAGLKDLVDAVGGVDVDVPERIDDPKAGKIVIEEGKQHLDGTTALIFARSRAYADGDFTRTSNQRLLVEAIVNKVLKTPMTSMPSVLAAAAECVTSDLNVTDIINLATQFRNAGKMTIYSAMVPSTTATIDGVSYVIADEQGLADMMMLIDAGEDPRDVQLESGAVITSSLDPVEEKGSEDESSGGSSGASESQ